MPEPSAFLGRPGRSNQPVSAVLEEALREEVRRSGIVIWLDRDAAYSDFAEGLVGRHSRGEFEIPIVPFRGSFLETLQALEAYGSGIDPEPLIVHLPGFTEETVRKTPLLELYEPGVRFRKALDTLVREASHGLTTPNAVEAFLAEPGLTLDRADAWLANEAAARMDGLDGLLAAMRAEAIVEGLLVRDPALVERLAGEDGRRSLLAVLERQTGMDEGWLAFARDEQDPLRRISFAIGAWVLAMEYVHDLKRPPHIPLLQPLAKASKPLVARCGDIARHLRARQPDLYEKLADEVEGALSEELAAMTPSDLGKIDTFRAEEKTILVGAIEALSAGEFGRVLEWADARPVTASFWAGRQRTHAWEWTLVREAAVLGGLLSKHGAPLQGARGLAEAVERYAEKAFLVDQAHRRFEQRRVALLEPRLPHFGAIQDVVAQLRRRYRVWSDQLARDFTALCREHGFLPSVELRQRGIWDEVVHPLAAGLQPTAVFLVDALRYEMADELAGELRKERGSGAGAGAGISLTARLAELPTVTAVGMNALAPVSERGRLAPVITNGSFAGFRAGEVTVRRPADRVKAMGARTTGKTPLLLDLKEVCETDPAVLARKVKGARLVVVASREIDDAGEASVGLSTFEQTLRQLRSAIFLLEGTGVRRFVVTADHGFLLLDETTAIRKYGTKRDPDRRYVLAAERREEAGMAAVALSELGYEGAEGFLLFQEDTALFDTPVAGASFVHGGNSLPERVIPVLVVSDGRGVSSFEAEWRLEATALPEVLGLSCMRLSVTPAPGSLAFAERPDVSLALRVPGRDDVEVLLRDARGGGSLSGGRVVVRSAGEGVEVFFSLQGPSDEKTRVEVFHPDGLVRVPPASPDGWFAVGRARTATVTPEKERRGASRQAGWESEIEDEGHRRLLVHLSEHGSVTEAEAVRILGSPRAFRSFSAQFDELMKRVPFGARVEMTPDGKRYVKERDK